MKKASPKSCVGADPCVRPRAPLLKRRGDIYVAPTACVILAAGKGVRMKSDRPKVLHRVGGRPMVAHPLLRARELKPERIVVVLGNGADDVKPHLGDDVKIAVQERQAGTGHAVMCARNALKGFRGTVLILYGDTPLLVTDSLRAMLKAHAKAKVPLTILTANFAWPNRLGRVIRRDDGKVLRVIEAADASHEELKIEEVNAGIYAVQSEFLFKALDRVKADNAQGEYYLTDIIEIAAKKGGVSAFTVPDPEEVLGVNDRAELAQAERAMNKRTLLKLMREGVTIIDPEAAYVHDTVTIGAETTIYPGAVIEGKTVIGEGCEIGPGAFVRDSQIGDGVEIRAHSVLDQSRVGDRTTVGPSAHLRPGSVIGADCRIGNFVETKKVTIGDGTKASHLTYLGDAEIGRNVNIGCGTITCNYDGEKKSKTIIEDDVFVGSDTQFVAPVRIGRGAYIGSGSTITRDVPAGALSVARARQRDLPGWGDRKRRQAKTAKRSKE